MELQVHTVKNLSPIMIGTAKLYKFLFYHGIIQTNKSIDQSGGLKEIILDIQNF